MLEFYLKSFYQTWMIDPFAQKLGKVFTPNQITLLACLTGVTVFPALKFGYPLLAFILILISGYCDMLDGTLARLGHCSSPKGAILDIISDRIVEFSIIFGLFSVDPFHRAGLALIMLGSCFLCVTSFLVVGIFVPNTSQKGFHYSPGLIERAEAFIFFLAMIALPQFFYLLAILFSSLVFLTAYVRVYQFIKFYRAK